ncbi:MAG: DNA-3-methyladenine glycosylase [Actinomycetes bacterium]
MGRGCQALSALGRTLPRSFYDRPVLAVARDLLGAVVVRRAPEGPVAIRLTEVEAYAGQDDPASHAFRGQTNRTAVMFGPPGHVYVYFTYGMHWCMNLVCGPAGTASAVLLRAGEVVRGIDLARERRGTQVPARDLARGPARLTMALGITGELNGTDAVAGNLVRLHVGTRVPNGAVATSPRTGVAGAGAGHPWRFHVVGDPTVSPYRPAVPRRRVRTR